MIRLSELLTRVNGLPRIVCMSRPRHPDKHVEEAIQYAESLGWRVLMSAGHAWGHLYCPLQEREGCRVSIWSTPRDGENHARQIVRKIEACPHDADGGEGNGGDDAG